MKKGKKSATKNSDSRKMDIEQKLEAALTTLKSEIGEKKFKKRISKAAKILTKKAARPSVKKINEAKAKKTNTAVVKH
ncbi:MAG: hypothetical protein EOP56_04430 [Sphingobacteriales bacterium]|nr:MAG: hypothetical protein EOP56_04430 [Sphingobacteriales bacterium]